MQDTEHFKVISETDHLALIELKLYAEFNGKEIRKTPMAECLEFHEFLLKTHNLLPVRTMQGPDCPASGLSGTKLVCHKQKVQD